MDHTILNGDDTGTSIDLQANKLSKLEEECINQIFSGRPRVRECSPKVVHVVHVRLSVSLAVAGGGLTSRSLLPAGRYV